MAETVISIPRIDVQKLTLTLVGDFPLVMHRFDEKSIRQMLDKQMKKAKAAKEAKDPWMDFCRSMYWLSEMPAKPTPQDVDTAKFGVRCVSFKSAAVGACRFSDGMKMTEARGAFHVEGEFAEILGPPPVMREDMVRVGMGTADVRFRGEFKDWRVVLTVSYNAAAVSAEQIINLFNLAGFHQGIGEMRPEKTGFGYGRFHVATDADEIAPKTPKRKAA